MAPTTIATQLDLPQVDAMSTLCQGYSTSSLALSSGRSSNCSATVNNGAPSPEPRTLLQTEAFISTLLQAVTEEDDDDVTRPRPLSAEGAGSGGVSATGAPCTSCEEGAAATSRCGDCSEMLCDPCVKAHQRVRITKDHHIIRFAEDASRRSVNGSNGSQASGSPCSTGLSPGAYCDHHHEPQRLYCESCLSAICGECALHEHRGHQMIYLQDALDGARNQSLQLLGDARAGIQAVREGLEAVQQMSENLEVRAHQTTTEIHTFIRKLIVTIEDREHELVSRVEQIRQMKGKALMIQMESLRVALGRLARISDLLNETLENTTGLELLAGNEKAATELKQLRSIRASLKPCEEASLSFIHPDSSVLKALVSFGSISTIPSSQSLARSMRLIKEPRLIINGPTPLVEDRTESLHAALRSCSIYGATNPVIVRCPRSTPSLVFGTEGENDGELCRPWGICCDKNGNIIVADRSNNRIQIFQPDGTFSHKFGEQGTGPGEFDRPASVAIDPLNRIVVTDKDNHRVQLFNMDGTFVLMFGEKGCRNGQFNYPWDVAVNTRGHIVVSDTRNHRVQLFSFNGQFINKYGFEGTATMWKHFDSPRGVCFSPNGDIIVTDFNNHRLVIIDPSFVNAQFLGCEGSGIKQFLRPQGIVCDDEGRIIVADSRNNRIQVFEANGNFLWKLGQHGKGPGELDRPSGICLNPNGQIVVIDFGNNRVQVF